MRITVNSEHDYIDTRRISKGNLRSAIFELILGEMSDITGYLISQLSPKARERQFL